MTAASLLALTSSSLFAASLQAYQPIVCGQFSLLSITALALKTPSIYRHPAYSFDGVYGAEGKMLHPTSEPGLVLVWREPRAGTAARKGDKLTAMLCLDTVEC